MEQLRAGLKFTSVTFRATVEIVKVTGDEVVVIVTPSDDLAWPEVWKLPELKAGFASGKYKKIEPDVTNYSII
jgi:hypothetical protein